MKKVGLFIVLVVSLFIESISAQVITMDNPPLGTRQLTGGNSIGEPGYIFKSIGDINGDGIEDFAISAPAASLVYVLYGRSNFQNFPHVNLSQLANFNPNGFIIAGARDSFFGAAIEPLGDMDRNGLDEFAIGAPFEGEGGRIYVFRGTALRYTSMISTTDLTPFLLVLEGTEFEIIGNEIGRGGDINQDGYADFFIPSPYRVVSQGPYLEGAAYLIYGQNAFPEKVISTAELDQENSLTITRPTGLTAITFPIFFNYIPDFTGDGLPDMVLTIDAVASGGNHSQVFVLAGGEKLVGTVPLDQVPTTRHVVNYSLFPQRSMNVLSAIEAADLDQDGITELIAGFAAGNIAGGNQPFGVISILFGSANPPAEQTLTQESRSVQALLGASHVSGMGNDRAFGDTIAIYGNTLAVGAPLAANPQIGSATSGAVYLLNALGLQPGLSIANIANPAQKIFYGTKAGDLFGHSIDLVNYADQNFDLSLLVSSPGDVNGIQGYVVPINAPVASPTPTLPPSITPTPAPTTVPTPTPGPSSVGDINGDGVINAADLYALASDWQKPATQAQFPSNLVEDASHVVNALDLLRLLEAFRD
ncbi:MAG: integrin alpha [bacterium]